MDSEHQSLLIGVIILLLIINTTAIFSLASEKGMIDGGQSAVTVTNKSPVSSPTVSATPTKTIVSPTVSAKATSAPTPGATSKTVAVQTQNTTVKAGTPANSSATAFKKYTNGANLFSLDYPADWTVAEINATLLKTITRAKNEPGTPVVEFYSPSITRCDQLNKDDCVIVRSEIRIDVDPNRKTKSVEDYYLNDIVRLADDTIQMNRKDAQIYVGGRKAYSLVYHIGESQATDGVSVIKVYVVIGDRAYIITCHSHDPKLGEEDQFVKYSDEYQHMIKSFTYAGNLQVL